MKRMGSDERRTGSGVGERCKEVGRGSARERSWVVGDE